MEEILYYCSHCDSEIPESLIDTRSGGFYVPYGEGVTLCRETELICPFCGARVLPETEHI